MAKPDSALLTRKRETPLQWEVLLVIVLILSLGLGRLLSPVFLTGANLSNVLADLTEIALMALPMTLIIVAAEIDLSVASVLGASSALMGVLWHMGLPMPVVIVLVLIAGAVLFTVLLQSTAFGRSLYAIGANPTAAAFSGIEVAKIRLRLFVLSGAMSALAGVVYTLRFTSARGDNGEGFELSVIAAVLFGGVSIFGGRGSMIGVLLSLLIIGVLRNALTLSDVSSETLTIVTGGLLLSSVLIPNLVARWRVMRDRKLIA